MRGRKESEHVQLSAYFKINFTNFHPLASSPLARPLGGATVIQGLLRQRSGRGMMIGRRRASVIAHEGKTGERLMLITVQQQQQQ